MSAFSGVFVKNTATGNQSVSGFGFSPKAMILWIEGTTADNTFTNGFTFALTISDGTTSFTFGTANVTGQTSGTNEVWKTQTALSYYNTSGTILAEGTLSFDADGFTINWTTNDAQAFRVNYLALGGASMQAKVGSFASGTTTGNLSVTSVGFQPNLVMMMCGCGSSTNMPNVQSQTFMGFGLMTSTAQWVLSIAEDRGFNPTRNARLQQTDKSIGRLSGSTPTANRWLAQYVSMDASGFTINVTTAPATSETTVYLAISGGNVAAGAFNKSTGGAPVSQSVSGLNFQPEAYLIASGQNTTIAGGQNPMRLGLGVYGGSAQAGVLTNQDNVSPTVSKSLTKGKSFVKANNDSGTIDAECDHTSLDGSGFTVNWTTNDAVATELYYAAFSAGQAGSSGPPLRGGAM